MAVKPQFHHSQPGFSLAEMLMQLAILIVVTVPMLMMLNLQKSSIAQDQQTTANKVLASQLFDRVSVQDSNPTVNYTAGPYANGAYYYSMACDPAIHPSSTNCPGTGAGPSETTGPFFQRTVTYITDINGNHPGIKVTVDLYHTAAVDNTNNPSYYETFREYQLDAYRINAWGMQPDSAGNMWFAENIVLATPVSGSPAYTSAYVAWPATGCGSPVSTVLTSPNVSAPFNKYQDIYCTGGSPGGMTYAFRVMPNKTYDINVYFVLPNTVSITLTSQSGSSGCLRNVPNASCAMADIVEESLNADYSLDTTFNTYQNFDINAATGMQVTSSGTPTNSAGYIFHDIVQTTGNTQNLAIVIRPASNASNSPGAHAYLSGIEVLRRDNQ